MSRKTIVFDANRFSDLASFYQEVENTCTKDLGWSIGRNLNAFNDVLRGGFRVHDYEEPIQLIWLNSDKSRKDLGWAEGRIGQTLFELIVDIIREHGHIELCLQ